MRRPRYASYLSLVYVAGLLTLLVVLAVLQYRWTGEASLAEQERMRQGLNDSLSFFERSLDREVSRAVLTYWQIPMPSSSAEQSDWQTPLEQALVDASRKWQAAAADARLVRRVLVAESAALSTPRLYAWNVSKGRLEMTVWPEELAAFAKSLQLQSQREFTGEEGLAGRYERRRFPGDIIIDEVPALVRQLVMPPARTRRESPTGGSPRTPERRICLIVCLDRDYVFKVRIPELAKRYLSRDGDTGYDYVIRSGQNRDLILASSPGADTASIVALPDASVRLLRLREDELDLELRRERPTEPQSAENAPRRRSPIGPGGGGGLRVEIPESDRLAQERSIEQRRHLQAAAEIFASRGWELLAKHRAGSLHAAVASTRLRNLAVSLGILLLLAVALVILTISVRSAQRLSRQQMEFVAGVSHELRTPIAVICSTAENLADGVITPNEQVRRYGQYILREGWRLDTLVEQTMEFAGIGSGIRRFHMETLDLKEVVSAAVDAFRTQISEKRLEVDWAAQPGAFVNGDAAALSCAIGNLLSNAVKYSRPGGKIRIGLETRPEVIVLEVADQGIGIEASEIRRLFEPFFRGSNARRAQIRGAGIGLSLVKSIVEAHRGTISAKSKIEEGSIFTLTLPATTSPAGSEKHKRDASNATQNSRG